MKEVADVEGLGKIVETRGNFYNQLLELKKEDARLISPRDEAYVRLQTRGEEDTGRYNGTRTTSGFEYAKKQLPIFKVKSRLTNLKLIIQSVRANRRGKYFHTDSTKEYEESLKQAEKDLNKDPVERNIIILPSRNNFKMSDKENWEIYQAILKDQAKPYFELTGPILVSLVNPKIVDSQNGTLLNYMRFMGLAYGSGLLGDYWDLYDNLFARGIIEYANL